VLQKESIQRWFQRGAPWVWLNAGAVAMSITMVFGLLGFIAYNGISHFWPQTVLQIRYQTPDQPANLFLGQLVNREVVAAQRIKEAGQVAPEGEDFVERQLLKVGNRDLTGKDFQWMIQSYMQEITEPTEVIVIERHEWGNFYGYPAGIIEAGQRQSILSESLIDEIQARQERASKLYGQIRDIETSAMGQINYGLERLRLKKRSHEIKQTLSPEVIESLAQDRQQYLERYESLKLRLEELYQQLGRDSLVVRTADGQEVVMPFETVVRIYQPNNMNLLNKFAFYFEKLREFIFAEPREANTEGGIFPAIFGTVVMVLIMSVLVTPFGVVAAVYLHEYAKQGPLTRTIRIAVNNLAGVPSIVYGVFGLGFFVYAIGGSLDRVFYPEAAPAPVFGTPGLLWASLTLALLTVPVVIVATEEGLSRIPRSLREGSLALGATKFETLWRVVIPMSSPAIMTGLILAVARAAGEVAPLMLVGVVKMAPSLPIDMNYPFVHLERKFMHLGFHIYDVGFQSPNVEAARPLVYATAFLLVAVIGALNVAAVIFRNRLRERHKSLEN